MDSGEYKTQTINAYNRIADTVITEFDEYFAAYARIEADYFLNTIADGSQILDLGCGGGVASQYFIHHGYAVISGDLSEVMLHECKRRKIPHLVRLDLEALPFHYQTFGAIWAHTSFIHIPKDRLTRAIEAILPTLQSKGLLFIALRGGGNEGYMERVGEPMWFSQFHDHEFEGYLPKELEIIRMQKIQPRRGIFFNYHLVKKPDE